MDETNKRVPFDPGWNDPPMLSYSETAQANKPRNLLNKRVPFPISANAPTPVAVTSPNYIRSTNTNEVKNVPGTPMHEMSPEESEEILVEIVENLYQLLSDNEELGPKVQDIKKRIGTMEKAWSSGILNSDIRWKMKSLALALKEDRPLEADNIHKQLMVDHLNSVCTWMVGVRHLINHCIVKQDLLSIDKNED